jgi:exodeoxyribonuclease V gamma subunit
MKTVSTSLDFLCGRLAENINTKGDDIFSREVIVVQTEGMKSWLTQELASRNKILANFSFVTQDSLYRSVYGIFPGENKAESNDSIKYRIFSLLGREDFRNAFINVADYYRNDDLKRIQLAGKVASLFEEYQEHRPEMIDSWENGTMQSDKEEERWQYRLWHELGG